MNPVYNILKKAYSSLGHKATSETLVKIRAAAKEIFSNPENHLLWSKNHLVETKEKMRLSAKNRNYNKSISFYVYSRENELLDTLSTLREAKTYFKADHRTFIKYLYSDL